MRRPFISVVTPVRNGEPYLRECIESVLAQTLEDWEYLIVNNASTDGTREIAEEYARMDDRIRVIDSPEPLPMMANWNFALRQISPESTYCKVIHADDLMYPECLRRMSDLASRESSVGLVGAARRTETGVDLFLDLGRHEECVFDGIAVGRFYLTGGRYLFGSPSNILLRSEDIRRRPAFYNENNIHADAESCLDILATADFGYIAEPLTFTRHHEQSATSKYSSAVSSAVHQYHILCRFGEVFLDESLLTSMRRYRTRKLYAAVLQAFLTKGPGALRPIERSLAALGYRFRVAEMLQVVPFAITGDRLPRAARQVRSSLEGRSGSYAVHAG